MTKKSILRLGFAIFGLTTIFSSIGLAVAYGLPNIYGSRNHLRIVENKKNGIQWYKNDHSFSSGGFAREEFGTSTVPQLIRFGATGENVKVINKNQPFDENFDPNLIDNPKNKFFEYLKLELAEKIIVNQGDDLIVFDNDNYINPNEHSINSDFFKTTLNDDKTTSIQFIIKKNIPWVNYQGKTLKNNEGKIYTIVPEDWVYGMYRTQMYDNIMRNSPVNSSNPFGGFGEKPQNISYKNWTKKWWYLSKDLQKMAGGHDFTTENGSNSYVYDLLNIQNPVDLVKISTEYNRPSMIGKYGKEDTISIKRKSLTEKSKLYDAVLQIVVNSRDFVPAPSQYINEVSSKINIVGGIELPRANDKDIIGSEINIHKYGIFTYGTSFDKDTLYAGAYYVSEDNSFRKKYEINPYYWDKEFVANDESVKSLTIDFFEVNDQQAFAQSSFNQYENERIFTTDLSQQLEKINDIKKQDDKYGLRYEQKINNSIFPADVFPLMLPKPNGEKYYFNDNFARVWFGTSLENIKNGKMTVANYLDKWSIAARSQITASINWYTQARTISSNDNLEVWNSYLPPDIIINPSNNNQTRIYDYKKDLNNFSYFEVENDGSLTINTISEQDNINQFENATTLQESLRSAQFAKIQIALEKTLTKILNGDSSKKITFEFYNRETATFNASKQKAMEQYVDIFKALNPRLDPQLKISLSLDAIRPFLTESVSIGSFHRWGPDYEGIGTWITGMSRERFGIQAIALGINSIENKQLSNAFPTLTEYGKILSAKIKTKITSYFQSINKQEFEKFYTDPKNFSLLNNFEKNNISAAQIMSSALFKHDKYDELSVEDKEILDQANLAFQKSIAAIDFELQDSQQANWWINLVNEQMSITGKYFGTQEIAIFSKKRFTEVMWQPWLIWSKISNGVYYLQDIKVIKLKK